MRRPGGAGPRPGGSCGSFSGGLADDLHGSGAQQGGDGGLAAGQVHAHVTQAVDDFADDLFPVRLGGAFPDEVREKGQVDLATTRGGYVYLHDILKGHPSLVDQLVHTNHRPFGIYSQTPLSPAPLAAASSTLPCSTGWRTQTNTVIIEGFAKGAGYRFRWYL